MASLLPYVAVRVPATSANLGPGFDCLALALDVWQEVACAVTASSGAVPSRRFTFAVHCTGTDAADMPTDSTNLVVCGLETALQHAGAPVCEAQAGDDAAGAHIDIDIRNSIPVGKGCGSSAAALVAGLCAGFALARVLPAGPACASPVWRSICDLAAEAEGHADNALACALGGLQVVATSLDGDVCGVSAVRVPRSLACVLLVPESSFSTDLARALLKDTVPRAAAVFNAARTATLVHAFESGQLQGLRTGTQDALHQVCVRGPTSGVWRGFPLLTSPRLRVCRTPAAAC